MPYSANIYHPNGEDRDARELNLSERKAKFFCKTEGCEAEMIVVNPGDAENAYFRSKHKSDHISPECVKSAIVFSPSKYSESRFSFNFAMESIMGLSHTRHPIARLNTGTAAGHIGGSKECRIHTLPMLYAMLISTGKRGFYNGLSIDDMLADNENYVRYCNGIEGYKVVETSVYKSGRKLEYIMNYPVYRAGHSNWVKIIFSDSDLYNKYRAKFRKATHWEPIIIAGNWEKIYNDPDKCHSQCRINKSSQIYWPSKNPIF